MTGGILQISATGTEDIYLTNTPNITFFKTIYRRHTNFSRAELDLNFTNRLDFGKEGYSRIEHYGDLLHRLFLVIHLPQIDIAFRTLTIGEVQTLLASPLYQITWETSRPTSAKFNESDFEEVSVLIDQKIDDLNAENDIIDEILATLTGDGKFVPSIWKRNNPDVSDEQDSDNDGISDAAEKYFNEIIFDYFEFDFYNLQYKIVDAHRNDVIQQRPLANSLQIQNLLLQDFIDYAISEDNNQFTFNDRNLEFIYNTDTANYVISGSISNLDSNTVFRSGIDNAYGGTPFMNLDAFKIFNDILLQNNVLITSSSDIQNLKSLLLTNIRFGLSKNITQLTNIYNSLNDDSRFIFQRRFPVIVVGSGTYDTNSSFTNQSLIQTNTADLDDRFTSDFNVPPEPNEPASVSHPFSRRTSEIVNNFHNTNRDLFRSGIFTPYFNDIVPLWSVTNAATHPQSPVTDPSIPANMYYLPNLWFQMTTEIPEAMLNYLQAPQRDSGLSQQAINDLFNFMVNVGSGTLLPTIRPLITQTENYTQVLVALDETVKRQRDVTGDIVMVGLIRPGFQNTMINDPNFGKVAIPDYITQNFLKALDDFEQTLSGDDLDSYQNLAKGRMINIVNLYSNDISLIPTYDTYITRNRNQFADPFRQINNINNGRVFSDVQSSIWNYLFKQFISNYNDLYNEFLLGFDFFTDFIGSELTQYLITISNDFLNYPIDENSFFDYYRRIDEYKDELPVIGGNEQFIGQFLSQKQAQYLLELNFYDRNRPLLNMRNIIIPRSEFFYEFFGRVVDEYTEIIETTQLDGTLVYDHLFHPDTNQDIVLITERKFNDKSVEFMEQRNNAIDITNDMLIIATEYFNTAGIPVSEDGNPYDRNTDPNKFRLWETTQGTFFSVTERQKFNNPGDPTSLFEWLYRNVGEEGTLDGPQELFRFNLQIDTLYNGFSLEKDVYNFMADYAIQQSTLKDLPGLLSPTVDETHAKILAYYQARRDENDQIINNINGDEDNLGLKAILERSLNTSALARFAWVRRIGHYLIERIWIKIDDQLVDRQYGEWLEIWHSITKRIKKEPGYNTLIGDVNDLTAFNTRKKYAYELVIPLQFWFCRNIGSSLPLVALHNADIRVYVKLRPFEQLAYFDEFTSFRSRPKLKCKMIGEFVYVEDEERNNLAKSKLEYLIDQLQFNGEVQCSRSNLNEDGFFEVITRFRNPCKELFWVLQRLSFIDGSLENGERRWYLYSYDLDGRINPAKKARIKFNTREREQLKDIEYFDLIHPYDKHYSVSENRGINIYSFALNPETLQPTGSANFNRIDDTSIEFNFHDELHANLLSDGNVVYRLAVYALSINVLRIFSGLGGVVFEQ